MPALNIGVDPTLLYNPFFPPECALVDLDDLDDVADGSVEAVQPRGDQQRRPAQPGRPPPEVDPVLLHPVEIRRLKYGIDLTDWSHHNSNLYQLLFSQMNDPVHEIFELTM